MYNCIIFPIFGLFRNVLQQDQEVIYCVCGLTINTEVSQVYIYLSFTLLIARYDYFGIFER